MKFQPSLLALLLATSPVAAAPPAPPAPAATPAPRTPSVPAARPAPRVYWMSDDRDHQGGTDTTIRVRAGDRLVLDSFAGDIGVRTWDRDAVRVLASHSRRARVQVERTDRTIEISAAASHGTPASVDYKLTVPAWMPIALSGLASDIQVRGVRGQITANSIKGDVFVIDSGDFVSAESVEGDVRIHGARGRVQANAINQNIEIIDCQGDVAAEAVNGDILVERGISKSINASTLNGRLVFAGPFQAGGVYTLSTHNGDILVGMPENPDVAVVVSTYEGGFSSSVPLQVRPGTRQRKHFSFDLGEGKSRLALESFQGSIHLARLAEVLDGKVGGARLRELRTLERVRSELDRAREVVRRKVRGHEHDPNADAPDAEDPDREEDEEEKR